ncbi:hypothetical protein EDC01DRAFT_779248 [Geopyxis carbonaria]|nr:hypothetical protein EDC01DRAFT_779248 [Geopyxis carbonaria]
MATPALAAPASTSAATNMNTLYTPCRTPLKRAHAAADAADASPVPRKRPALTPQRTPDSHSRSARRVGLWSDDDRETETENERDTRGTARRLRLRLKMALYKVQTNQVQTPFPKLRLPREALGSEEVVEEEAEAEAEGGVVPPSSPPCLGLDAGSGIGAVEEEEEELEEQREDEEAGHEQEGGEQESQVHGRVAGRSVWPTPRKSPPPPAIKVEDYSDRPGAGRPTSPSL